MPLLAEQIIAILLVSLRIAPTFAFAPPFTLLRVPLTVRLLLSLSIAAWLGLGYPDQTYNQDVLEVGLIRLIAGELFLGIALALSLQLAFAAMLVAGRTLDIQTGFGLALLIDPTTRTQTPLIGTLFAYAAGAIFFGLNGPVELLALWAISIQEMPLGSVAISIDINALLTYISAVFMMSIGLAGIVLLTLFLIDLTVAFMSRTLPQMNVLLLGFQIKTFAVLATLPLTIAISGTIFLRIVRMAINYVPRLT
jgi:flagellar biosynthetic protein FliR